MNKWSFNRSEHRYCFSGVIDIHGSISFVEFSDLVWLSCNVQTDENPPTCSCRVLALCVSVSSRSRSLARAGPWVRHNSRHSRFLVLSVFSVCVCFQ